MDLLITIALIFFLTLVLAYLRSRVKDRCLKSFSKFQVTMERAGGKLIWGRLRLESSGLELVYPDSIQDEKHIESSYVMYASEFSDIQAIYRYVDELTEEEKEQRQKDLDHSFHPRPLRRIGRKMRNFLSTATDSLNEVMSVVLGRVQKTGGRYISEGGGAALTKLGGKVLGQMGGMQDPLLEMLIGQRVVLDLLEGGEVHEHVGILQNYSPDFILLLEISYPVRREVTINTPDQADGREVSVSYGDGKLRVENKSGYPVLLQSIRRGDSDERLVNAVVSEGDSVELFLSPDLPQGSLRFQAIRELDMIVPRTRCLVRHRAEQFRQEAVSEAIFDLIFDVGTAITHDLRRDAQEARLRQELSREPRNAVAAANLGYLLLKRQEYAEAEKWLCLALDEKDSLPDGGRRVGMQLREIERQRSGSAAAGI